MASNRNRNGRGVRDNSYFDDYDREEEDFDEFSDKYDSFDYDGEEEDFDEFSGEYDSDDSDDLYDEFFNREEKEGFLSKITRKHMIWASVVFVVFSSVVLICVMLFTAATNSGVSGGNSSLTPVVGNGTVGGGSSIGGKTDVTDASLHVTLVPGYKWPGNIGTSNGGGGSYSDDTTPVATKKPTVTPEPETTVTVTPEPDITVTVTPDGELTVTPEPEITATVTPDGELTVTPEPEITVTATATPDAEITVTTAPEPDSTQTPVPEQ